MPGQDPTSSKDLARLFLSKAEQDLSALRYLTTFSDVADEIIGFHAQQTAEKSLKAVLIWHEIPFRRTHDLAELLDLLVDHGITPPERIKDIDALNPFAVELRYGVFTIEEPSVDRHQILQWAEDTFRWAKSLLA